MKTSIVALFLGVAAARLRDYSQVQVRFLEDSKFGLSQAESDAMIFKTADPKMVARPLTFSEMIDKINSPEALSLNQGVPVLVEPTLMVNEVGTVPLGLRMKVGNDYVSVIKKQGGAVLDDKSAVDAAYIQTENPVVNPPFNNWSIYQPSVKHARGLDGAADLGQNMIIDGHKASWLSTARSLPMGSTLATPRAGRR